MSLRHSLSPNQKFSIIVASIAILLAAETGGLFVLSQRYPAQVEVATRPPIIQPEGLPEKPLPAPTQERVFTVPGAAPVNPPAGAPNALPPAAGMPPIVPAPGNNAGPLTPNGAVPGGSKNNLAAKPGEKESPQKAEARAAFQTGVDALKKNDAKTAITSFERVVALVPDNLPSHLNLASIYLQLQQPKNALPHLEKAAQLDPKSAAVHFNMGRTLLALRRPQDALVQLRETVRLAPDEREGRLLLAQVLTQTGQAKAAYTHWVYLAQKNKTDVEAHLTAAAIANDVLNQPKTAEKWLRESIGATPRDPQAPLMLGRLLLGRGQAKEAKTILTAATQARPDVFELYPLLADAKAATGDTKGAISSLQSAILRLPAGKTAEEKKRIGFAEGGLRISLGQVLGNSKRVKEAQAEFQKAAKLRPNDPTPYSLGATASLQFKDKEAAIGQLQTALKLDAKRMDDRRTLIQLLADAKRWKEADAQLADYVRTRPRDLEALVLWAQVARAAKNTSREKQVAIQITQIAPKNPLGWTQLAVLQREAGDKKGALATFTKLSALTPNDPNAAFEVARLQSALGNHEAAFSAWQKVVRNKPEYAPSYGSLLQAGDEANERGAARAFLVRQLSGKSENVPALNEILGFYENKKRPEEAKAFLADLLSRNPKFIATKAALATYDTPKEAPKEKDADQKDEDEPKKGADEAAPKDADKPNGN